LNKQPIDKINLKKSNQNRVYNMIYRDGPVSKSDLTHGLNVSLPTINQNIKHLMDLELIREDGSLDSTGGRKPVAYSCVHKARTAIGLDITLNHIIGAIIDLNSKILFSMRRELKFEVSTDYARILGEIVSELITESESTPESVLGVGLSVPGTLSEDSQTIIFSHVIPTNIRCSDLNYFIPYPTQFCNDANAAGMAEFWNRSVIENAIYISLSNSVGGAIILDNAIYLGENQRSGELGHITVERSGNRCHCGKKGCLDVYCSAMNLSRLTGGSISEFFKLLDSKDPIAQKLWADYIDYLATGINILRSVFDCNVIVGGYVGANIGSHINDLRTVAASLNTFEQSAAYIESCTYKREASAVGAALVYISDFLDEV
jgi:predicted NBD/HSP70 family sugar kinase